MGIAYFEYFLYVLIAFFITYVIGNLVFSLFDEDNSQPVRNAFVKNILGLWTIIFTYSIIKTGFFTINLGFIILIIYLVINYKVKFRLSLKINFSLLIFQCLILLSFYTIFYLKYYNPINKTYHELFCDFPTYACFIENMNKNGLESRFYDYLNYPPVRELYHFGDLWLAAFFAFIFKKTALAAFYFIMFPLLTTIFSIGLLALLNPVKISYKLFFFSIIFLFISTISIFFPKSIPFFNTEWAEFTMLNSPKRTIAGLVLLTSMIMASEKKYLLVILSLLVIVCVYTISAPVIYVFSALYILYLFFAKKISLQDTIMLFLPMLFMFVFTLIYIKVCSDINSRYLPKNAAKLIELPNLADANYYLTAIKAFIGLLIKFLLGTSLFAILFFLNKEKNKFIIGKVAFIVVMIISGYIVHALLYFVAEANQLYTVTYISAIAILIVLLLYPIYESKGITVKLIAILLIAVCFYQNLFLSKQIEKEMDTAFFKEVKRSIPNNTPYRFGAIYSNLKKDKTKWSNFNFYYPYHYFKLYFDDYNPLFLSIDNLKIDAGKNSYLEQAQATFIKASPFYIFLEKEKKSNPNIIYNDAMLLFIIKYNIKYIIISPDSQIPEQINKKIVKTIEAKRDGYKLCIIN